MKKFGEFRRHLKKATIDDIHKAHVFFRFKYPKLLVLIISIILAYFIFTYPPIVEEVRALEAFGYVSIFVFGLLLAFGFTAPFAVGFFLTISPQNIFLAALIGGVGAIISDSIIFKFIRFSLSEEFEKLEEERPIKKISKLIKHDIGLKASTYLLYFLAGIIIASPLPDEFGITMFAGLTHIKESFFTIISFVLHTAGIFVIIFLGSM